MSDPVPITAILEDVGAGAAGAQERLIAAVYDELCGMARRKMAREAPGHSLQATALVHEAYLRLFPNQGAAAEGASSWKGRAHFFGAAAEAMRRILIDRARHRRAQKRGGDRKREAIDAVGAVGPDCSDDELVALDEALRKLEMVDRRGCDVVKLRYFAGLTIEQAAEVLGVSLATANRDWTCARARLALEMSGAEPADGS